MGTGKVTSKAGRVSVTAPREKKTTRAQRAATGETVFGMQATQNPDAGVLRSRGRLGVLRDKNGNVDFEAMRERTAQIQQNEAKKSKKKRK